MTTNEFYFLIVVLGGFGSFAVGLATARLQYTAWLRRQQPRVATQPVVRDAARPVLARAA